MNNYYILFYLFYRFLNLFNLFFLFFFFLTLRIFLFLFLLFLFMLYLLNRLINSLFFLFILRSSLTINFCWDSVLKRICFCFISKKFFPTDSYALSDLIFCFLNFLIILFIKLHEWFTLFHCFLHYFELFSLSVYFFIFLHFLLDKFSVLLFCHLIFYSSTLSVSTESVVIGTNFFTTLIFKFSTIPTFTS